MPVFFLDIGYHFPETLALRDRLISELGIRVENLSVINENDGLRQQHTGLHRTDPDLCCYIIKVEPFTAGQDRSAR